ncbi:shikimate kinase [Diaminobutyricibacter tongyongensis]|uniref:Shikimate kinase n=1 Tax=Leifsonia tongyongensis TaxID=1268043 RepID=A0A6L9XZ56_9MICO|nr:shikimate kinase [Diaminobutyricibacter tongyongensis]
MTVVLIGPPAAGKTRIGKRLATRLGRPFIDTDHEIVAEHGPIAQIFADHGEPYFRRLEREAVVRALDQHAVVSLGGGAVLDPQTQADLAAASVILLTVDADAVAARIGTTKRPLVTDLASWQALVDSRAELYASLADYSTDTSTRPLDAIVEEIALWVEGNR